jgi:MerR family transcriptional regulator, thiopeptide resistance regulator
MGTPSSRKRRWRVGELAEAAGVTVRALHHYEQLGLLAPAERTDGGHRLYDEAGVERLFRIRVLRGLGVPLEWIGPAIDGGAALGDVLRAQLDRVEDDVERVTRLRDRLRGLAAADGPIGAEDLLATLGAMVRVERRIRERRASPPEVAERRWRAVGDELRACMEAGDEPVSGRARAAATRARELLDVFAGGDRAVLDALARLRRVDPPRGLAGWDPDLTCYLDRALAVLDDP